MDYDLKIQRHRVAKAAAENGWSRVCTPRYDILRRGITEVSVWYFEDGARINGADITETTATRKTPARPQNREEQVLAWLNAPGE